MQPDGRVVRSTDPEVQRLARQRGVDATNLTEYECLWLLSEARHLTGREAQRFAQLGWYDSCERHGYSDGERVLGWVRMRRQWVRGSCIPHQAVQTARPRSRRPRSRAGRRRRTSTARDDGEPGPGDPPGRVEARDLTRFRIGGAA